MAWHLPPSQAFPRLSGKHARAGDKREAAREGGDGNERRAQGGSDGEENSLRLCFP